MSRIEIPHLVDETLARQKQNEAIGLRRIGLALGCPMRVEPVEPVTCWHDATTDVPDADILVLACNSRSESYWIATFDGATWRDADSEQERRVTHWMDLPEVPQ